MTIINSYMNGNCAVNLYSDGTKTREYEGSPLPKYPESLDVKITDWCDAGCAWCHEKSSTKGKHAELGKTIDLLKQLPAGVEIAIGGGHPLSHPDFKDFVQELSDHGLICNVTVNEYHFSSAIDELENLISDGWVKGVGYSYKEKPCLWDYEHLVSHVIAGAFSYEELGNIIQTNKKILLLGYKRIGRGLLWGAKNETTVNQNINSWYRGLFRAVKRAQISFDNLAIKQLNPRRLFVDKEQYDQFYMGDDGNFSMYFDAVNQDYAVSSTSQIRYNYKENITDMFPL